MFCRCRYDVACLLGGLVFVVQMFCRRRYDVACLLGGLVFVVQMIMFLSKILV